VAEGLVLAGLASSLASQLPQVFSVCARSEPRHKNGGSGLARDGGLSDSN